MQACFAGPANAASAPSEKVAPAAASYTNNWLQYGFAAPGGRYNQRENVLSAANVGGITTHWSASDKSSDFTSSAFTSLAVAGDEVYTGQNAFDAATGALKWTNGLGDATSPAFADGKVFIPFAFGQAQNLPQGLCAFDASKGTRLWCIVDGFVTGMGAPAVVGGVVYFADLNAVSAFDETTGAQLWTATIGGYGGASPAVAHGVVYTESLEHLYARDAKTGTLLWSLTGNPYTGNGAISPLVANGVLYALDSNSRFAAFDAKTGALLWSSKLGETSYQPATANGVVYLSAGNLYALDATTGKTIWTAPLGNIPQNAPATSSPAVANGVVYICDNNNALKAFEAKVGALLASVPGVCGPGSPVVSNGVVYTANINLTASQGSIFALGLGNGRADLGRR